MKNYVIIGNGVAAAGCIEGIRSVDAEGSITVVSEEKHPVYCRPLISYYLERKTDTDRMLYRGPDFYEKNSVDVQYGRKALRIDTKAKKVELDDGSALPYDALLVATGSAPFVPKFEGIESVKDRFLFMTWDDAMALDAAVSEDSKVLIIGAGMIGLKCAEGLSGRVAEITVCDLADRVLPSVLDKECADLMQKRMEEHGIKFLMENTAVRFEGNVAHMKNGETLPFDVLVLAVGIRPSVSLVKDAGGNIGRGIITDEHMESSIPGIFAAGDCAECRDASSGEMKVLANMPNAYMQGHAAGVTMAGGSEAFDKGILMNSIGFFGLHAMAAGCCEGDLFEEKDETSIKRLYTKDGLLKGYILVGRDDRAGIYTSLIREKTPLSSLNFEMLRETAALTAFSPVQRRQKLGGVV